MQAEYVKYVDEEVNYEARRGVRYFLKCISKSKSVIFGATVIILFLLVAIFAPIIAPNNPEAISLVERMQKPVFMGGTWKYPLGTDQLGRCILSRIIYGARISMIVGCFSVFFSGLLGVVLGLLSGFFGGIVDDIIMRISEIIQAFPFILLAIAILSVLGSGIGNVIIVLAITGWVQYCRVVRSEVISVREKEYIEATKAMGLPVHQVIFGHVLPNVVSSVIVIASFSFASSIISEASLSFLGLGVSPTVPTWGQMISKSRDYIFTNSYMMIFPSIAVVLVVLGINIFGDWLRDYLDPKTTNF